MKKKSSIDEMLSEMEEAIEPPPEPKGGIPKQWVPSWIRWPLRAFALPWVILDLYAQKIASWIVRPPYRREGKCLKRGNCCHYILLPETKGAFAKLNLFYNTEIQGFYLRSQEVHDFEGEKILVMGCRYLQKDGSCKHYYLRPVVCRQWPMVEYFGRPRILKGCGFKAVERAKPKLTVLK